MTSSNSSSVKSSSISFRISLKKKNWDSFESNTEVFYPKFFDTDKASTNIIKNPEMLKFIFSKWYCHRVRKVSTWKRLLIHPRWALPDLKGRPGTLSPLLHMYQVIILQYSTIFHDIFLYCYHQDIVHWLQKPPQQASRTINLKMFWAEIQGINSARIVRKF